MSAWRLPGWSIAPRLGLLLPPEGDRGWTDAAWWAAQLEGWGLPFERLALAGDPGAPARWSTLIVPAASPTEPLREWLEQAIGGGTSLLVAGEPGPAAARLLGLRPSVGSAVERLRLDAPGLREAAHSCLPSPDGDGAIRLDPGTAGFDIAGGIGADGGCWHVLARWLDQRGAAGPVAIAHRPAGGGADRAGELVWFGVPADRLDWRASEAVGLAAERALAHAAPEGLVGLWRWPAGKAAALVVDGDVDHPSGVDPECSRYVAPALETAARAGFGAYGIFVAAANVDAEPASFAPGPGYYNHSYGHPYSYWDPRRWEELTAREMADELRRADATYRRRLGRDDDRLFRLPHFQLGAAERTYAVLDELGYRAESSVGSNRSVTAGLPYHPAIRVWGDRSADAAYARTHPDPERRHRFLQLPISTDPSDPGFLDGCCSYNVLGGSVRARTADPADYERLLDNVVEAAVARRGLAHLFIDPPDAGYGRLPGDRADYAGAVERWLRRCVARDDLAILTTAGLAGWWLEREAAVRRFSCRLERGALVVDLGGPPAGATLAVLPPRADPATPAAWRLFEVEDPAIDRMAQSAAAPGALEAGRGGNQGG